MDAPATASAVVDPAFRDDVLAGLAAPIPAVPARWLYDRRGSELFEQITDLPEYYPTRIETALLQRYCASVAEMTGRGGGPARRQPAGPGRRGPADGMRRSVRRRVAMDDERLPSLSGVQAGTGDGRRI
jgi:hypothetical protein